MSTTRARFALSAALVATLAACSGTPADSGTSSAAPADATSAVQIEGMGKGPDGSGLDRFMNQRIQWKPCNENKNFDCADIWVPLDYKDPDSTAITIATARLKATGGAKYGSLITNPGGPGASGRMFMSTTKFSPALRAKYDIIGFDPRGVGGSTPLECLSDAEFDKLFEQDPSPDDDAEIAAFEQAHRDFTAACQAKGGKLFEHLTTVEAAKDMDILRSALGEQKFDYLGISYGTYLGATYAALFPDKVDRMVLDSAVDPNISAKDLTLQQASGFERALSAYLQETCVKTGKCPLGNTVDAARKNVAALLKKLDAAPLPAAKGRKVTESVAAGAISGPLYDKKQWPMLTQVLAGLLQGKGAPALAAFDMHNLRLPDGKYVTNRHSVISAVNCLDRPDDASVEDIRNERSELQEQQPVFGPAAPWSRYGCSNWPVKSSVEKPDYAANGAKPIVVAGITRDPATPYEWSKKLAETLSSGVLVTLDGDGHGAFTAGSACMNKLLESYLTEGQVPADGSTCTS